MSATQYQKVLERELARLNQKIDVLIMKGQAYSAESKRHKEILAQLKRVQRPSSMFGRLFTHAASY